MKKASVHYNWLRLIEVSGPFVSATALDEAFPNGLDGLDKGVKRQLSRYYDEWLEAMETNSPYFEQLHAAWCEAVLREGLEFRENDLESANSYVAKDDAGIGTFTADKVLKDDAGKPLLFVKFLASDVRPADRDVSDEWKDSCIEKMTRLCRMHDVRVGLVTNGEQWVLVNAAPGGSLSGSATWYVRLWFQEDETLRAFVSLLGFRRFVGAPKKRLPYLLDESLKHLEEVTDTLGKQVMAAVEVLLEGFDRTDLDANRTLLADVAPQELYEASLTVMMRLIFLLCAEERGLMLLGEKKYDDVYAVSTLRNKLEKDADRYGPQVLERRFDAWARLLSVFRAVFAGIDHSQLKLAAMGGSLFDPDKYPFLEGRSKDERWRNDNPPPLPIDNRTVLHLLESLQVLNHKNGAIQLSFRSLDVEQIGYIYEGLLEFTAKKASETLVGLKGDKSHLNPEIALSELESLAMDSKEKLFARVKELTGRSALEREYTRETDESLMPQLVKVCRGDESLKSRILPYLNWIRLSAWGEPVVYHKDSFYVTEGTDRRSSGTHYTPRALTEMIVREALEPVVYDGPAKGTPRAEWKLKSPSELLDLKVCDPAMGSGAFLVQACRYLGDRLVEAWAAAEKDGKAVASNGTVAEFPPNDPMSNLLDDRICEARRLVAEKCLYGVDINPLAVELAKLSLWLVTISKGRPFGFLDHNLKSGDSLLGVSDIKQLIQFRMKPSSAPFGNLLTTKIESAVAEALVEREAIRSGRSRDIKDVALLQQHYRKAEELTRRIKEYADFFIGEVLVAGKPGKKTDAKLDAAAMEGADLIDGDTLNVVFLHNRTKANLAYDLPAGQTAPRRPFHWAIEFPEVFAQGGFNAIVGNPPFSGGRRLKESIGEAYHSYMVRVVSPNGDGAKNADLCAYFFLHAYSLIRSGGIFGLIASNSIAEGDTRQTGLEQLVNLGAEIIVSHPNMPWPGVAAVYISPTTVFKQSKVLVWNGQHQLNDKTVELISAFLSAQTDWTLQPLEVNKNQSFQGSLLRGKYFIITDDEARVFIVNNPKNQDVLSPYLTGEDLNSAVEQTASRWVINFRDWPLDRNSAGSWNALDDAARKELFRSGHVPLDYCGKVASDYPDILALLKQKCEGENGGVLPGCERPLWWQFWCPRPELYHTIGRGGCYAQHPDWWYEDLDKSKVCAVTRVSKTLAFAVVPNNVVFADTTIVFTRKEEDTFGILQSCFHAVFAWKYSSRMKTDLRYVPNDCYKTFPFPNCGIDCINDLAEQYLSLRSKLMSSLNCGLTALYKRYHNHETTDQLFNSLRKLQREIDEAVRDAYGWSDIDLGHGFHEVGYLPANDNVRYTISESARIEILKRLSALNRQRWEEEEKAGLHKKGKK